MAIKFSDITGGGIPFGNTASRPANPGIGKLYSNGEAARLELYTQASGWQNIVQEVPGVSSITGNYSEATNSGTITIAGTNFVSGAIASAIGTNGVEVLASSTTYNSLVQLTAVFTGLSNANEPYDIKVTNPSNLFGMIPDALYVNASPVWQTASGSLGTFYEQVTISLSTTATDSDSTTSYALANGSSLPSGVTLNSSTGLISGTLPNISSNTTYSFTINAVDGVNTIPRSFSITSLAIPIITGGALTSDSTYYYRTFSTSGSLNISDVSISGVDILTYAGGGAGGSQHGGGGGGAGGYVYSANQTLNPGTYTIVVGGGGSYASRDNGSNSRFGALAEAIGGGAGATEGQDASVRARVGGSGGGGGGTYPAGQMAGAAGTSGQGNSGGSGVQVSNYSGGAGGGGAGSAGSNNSGAGNGGAGLNTWSTWAPIIALGTSGYILGGGGGGGYGVSGTPRGIGSAGGGNGAIDGEGQASAGVEGTGSGGGGSSGTGNNGTRVGNSGGSGRVILRYTKAAVGG